jgi:glutamate-ammonia-ligase adenylyltransferase
MSRRHRLHALACAIDAPRARDFEARLAPSLGAGTDALALAALLAAAYPALGAAIEAWPDLARRLAAEGWRAPRDRAGLLARLREAAGDALDDEDRVRRELRRFAHAERARIALRELLPSSQGGADVDVTARELSFLAEATIEVALDEAVRTMTARYGAPLTAGGAPSRFVVLGMGKLGGLELNAGSDVDLVFLYDTDDGEARLAEHAAARGPATLHDVWTRVARRLTATLAEPTAEGFVWRVDLRLRPEGQSGPLVNSLAAAERYYEAFGRLWERAALLRARPVAGDLAFGEEALAALAPFVWRRRVDPSIAVEIAHLARRARAELSHDAGRDLKLGPGGIREAEFFVQTLQLVWGGREPDLRAKGTLVALRRLRAAGLVTDREGRDVEGAYLALRRAEHAVQSATGVQTHLRPAHPGELARLARALGFADGAAFLADLGRHTRRVAACFASLAPEGVPVESRWIEAVAALDRADVEGFADAFARVAAVAEAAGAGAAPPQSEAAAAPSSAERWRDVARDVFDLARRPDAPLGGRSREAFPALADTFFDAVVDAADPEQAARYLRTFFARLRRPEVYVRPLGDDPRAVRRLVTMLGASAFLGDAVVNNPELGELVLFSPAEPSPAFARDELAKDLVVAATMAAAGQDEEPDDAFVAALRRAKARVTALVGLADLADEITPREATLTLSALADATLEAATRRALDTPDGAPVRGLAVIAMGKLGGREIGHGSDLDVLFLFDPAAAPAGADPDAFFARAARRVIRLIGVSHPAGPGYELDTRLRPSGSQGLLVTSLEAFARYHGVRVDGGEAESSGPAARHVRAAPWERVALLRARASAGDVELGAAAIRVAHATAYELSQDPGHVAAEVRRLRARMERELSQERRGRRDLKLGRGGLVDVELAVQLLQIEHGGDPAVRTTETAVAIEALAARGYLAPEHADALRDGYAFLRRLEQRIRIVHGDATQLLEERAPGVVPLARRMGIRERPGAEAAAELLARYREVTERVRGAYEAIVGGVGSSDTAEGSPRPVAARPSPPSPLPQAGEGREPAAEVDDPPSPPRAKGGLGG